MKDVFVGVLPSVAGLVMGRRAPPGVFVDQLPQRLPLEISPVARGAVAHIDFLSECHRPRVIGIGEMRGGWRRNGEPSAERGHDKSGYGEQAEASAA